jgi:acyl carrier protein
VTLEEIIADIESFVRSAFAVSPDDAGFDRDVNVFDAGYVDSVGLLEVLAFIDGRFAVEIAEDDLLSEEFSTVAGMGRIVYRARGLATSGTALKHPVERRP